LEESILTVLADGAASFSKGQRKIAQYITANYEKAAFMTASRLGEMVGVSESTVVRFATELGYDGYPEMRRALQEMIKNSLTSVQRMEVSRDLIESKDILSAVLSADIEKIRRTLEEVDKESFGAAVDALVSADHIYVLGLRSSSALAVFLGFYLNLMFPNVKVVSDSVSGELFEHMLRVHKGDVFVGISFPRYSRRTIKAMEYARNQGANVICITDAETSLVAKQAMIRLYAKSSMVSFVDSLVAPLSLINALLVAAAGRAKGDIAKNFEKLEGIWSEYGVYEKNEL